MGDLEDAEAAGECGSMVGGMGVRITLAWLSGPRGEPCIRDLRARVLGSAAPVAPASWLVEHARGMTWEEAARIRAPGILEGLGRRAGDGLPRAVRKGCDFAVEALRCALGLPRSRPSDPQGPGILVCRCLDVGDHQIRAEIRRGARTPEAIGDGCGACTGCRSCRPDLLWLLHEELRGEAPIPPRDLHPVARIALARVGPALAALGHELRDASVTDGALRIRLGPPSAASLPSRSALGIARYVLRETVSEDIAVELADGGA